jgi:hypothetical protein
MTCCGSPTGTGSTPTEKPRLEADGRPATALGRSHDRMADLAGIAAADLNVGENSIAAFKRGAEISRGRRIGIQAREPLEFPDPLSRHDAFRFA